MKLPFRIILLLVLAALSSCGERDQDKKRRLKAEVLKIQDGSLRAILKNDFKFIRSFAEDERLYANLRSDLERCREIEVELQGLESDDVIATIRQNTDDLLELYPCA